MRRDIVLCLTLLAGWLTFGAQPSWGQSGFAQTSEMIYEEAETVYLGNLARRANGVPPLRWNLRLTNAARWFAWDSVEDRLAPYCGHVDTQGQWPRDRVLRFGYNGDGGAENAFCGPMTPQQGIDGWMNSPDHRANMLDTHVRETGLGYFLRPADGCGYVVQDFGADEAYPPVIINDEAISTTWPAVHLYIHSNDTGSGLASMGPALQMMVSNDDCFAGARWEPYRAETAWILAPGEGWRNVYVKTRDALSRTSTVGDSIYLGANVPLSQLGAAQMSSAQQQVTLYGLKEDGLPKVQFSLGWVADDTLDTFGLIWGLGERVSDPAALGGSAYRLLPGHGESFAWAWTTDFVRDTPLVAYFRLKVSDNTSHEEVIRFSIKGGGTEYGPLSLRGTDFCSTEGYQEFPLAFTYATDPDDAFLIFQFWRSGSADVDIDAVRIFTLPQPVSSTVIWNVPDGNYRGQGVWVRYTDGEQRFSAITEASIQPLALAVSPVTLNMLAVPNGARPATRWLTVRPLCGSGPWQVRSNAPWLQAQADGESIRVMADQSGLELGAHLGSLTVSGPEVAAVTVPITLLVVEQADTVRLAALRPR